VLPQDSLVGVQVPVQHNRMALHAHEALWEWRADRAIIRCMRTRIADWQKQRCVCTALPNADAEWGRFLLSPTYPPPLSVSYSPSIPPSFPRYHIHSHSFTLPPSLPLTPFNVMYPPSYLLLFLQPLSQRLTFIVCLSATPG
jgi:hypothetical protein